MKGTITAIGTTPVKGLQLQRRTEGMLTETGAADDRRFFVIDDRNRMVNNKRVASLLAVVADYDPRDTRLTLTFPDGASVAAETEDGLPANAALSALMQARPFGWLYWRRRDASAAVANAVHTPVW